MQPQKIKKPLKALFKRLLLKFFKAGGFRVTVGLWLFEGVWHVFIKPALKAKAAEMEMNKRKRDREKEFKAAKEKMTEINLRDEVEKIWKK